MEKSGDTKHLQPTLTPLVAVCVVSLLISTAAIAMYAYSAIENNRLEEKVFAYEDRIAKLENSFYEQVSIY